jgi:hypothetical protein
MSLRAQTAVDFYLCHVHIAIQHGNAYGAAYYSRLLYNVAIWEAGGAEYGEA